MILIHISAYQNTTTDNTFKELISDQNIQFKTIKISWDNIEENLSELHFTYVFKNSKICSIGEKKDNQISLP